LQDTLRKLQVLPYEMLLQKRFNRLMGYGKFKEAKAEHHS
jgi:acetyl-CoA carboxylase carboxyl transferase subunit alpha